MDWDAPWETKALDADAVRNRWTKYYVAMRERPDDATRWRFEIESEGQHIGWVSSYLIDTHYDWISNKQANNGKKAYRAIGIDICESNIWGRHIGTNALRAFIRYYAELGCRELYTQTWSGNVHMIRVAETLGFQECNRLEGEREVRGETYDGLTFVLKM